MVQSKKSTFLRECCAHFEGVLETARRFGARLWLQGCISETDWLSWGWNLGALGMRMTTLLASDYNQWSIYNEEIFLRGRTVEVMGVERLTKRAHQSEVKSKGVEADPCLSGWQASIGHPLNCVPIALINLRIFRRYSRFLRVRSCSAKVCCHNLLATECIQLLAYNKWILFVRNLFDKHITGISIDTLGLSSKIFRVF